MQLKEKKEFPYLESPNSDMYTSPFFSFSSHAALSLQLKEKTEPVIHFSRPETPYRKKELLRPNSHHSLSRTIHHKN